jgi:hypothetical protein
VATSFHKWYVAITLFDLLRYEYQIAKYMTPLNGVVPWGETNS